MPVHVCRSFGQQTTLTSRAAAVGCWQLNPRRNADDASQAQRQTEGSITSVGWQRRKQRCDPRRRKRGEEERNRARIEGEALDPRCLRDWSRSPAEVERSGQLASKMIQASAGGVRALGSDQDSKDSDGPTHTGPGWTRAPSLFRRLPSESRQAGPREYPAERQGGNCATRLSLSSCGDPGGILDSWMERSSPRFAIRHVFCCQGLPEHGRNWGLVGCRVLQEKLETSSRIRSTERIVMWWLSARLPQAGTSIILTQYGLYNIS
jgi:hypothetical protein